MPSPIKPSQFCDAVPASNADFCTRFTKFLNVPQLLCDLFSWMFNADGSLSQNFQMEAAQFSTPTGAYMGFATLNVGDGWLYCDGREVSRTTYATLFNAIGTVHGAGNGTTTFNLPDARGRSLIGAGTGDGLSVFRDINSPYVGEETHTQTVGEMAAHIHDYETSDSQQILVKQTVGKVGDINQSGSLNYAFADPMKVAGGSVPFNVTHASLVCYWHIKS